MLCAAGCDSRSFFIFAFARAQPLTQMANEPLPRQAGGAGADAGGARASAQVAQVQAQQQAARVQAPVQAQTLPPDKGELGVGVEHDEHAEVAAAAVMAAVGALSGAGGAMGDQARVIRPHPPHGNPQEDDTAYQLVTL